MFSINFKNKYFKVYLVDAFKLKCFTIKIYTIVYILIPIIVIIEESKNLHLFIE